MKIVSVNANGIRAAARKGLIHHNKAARHKGRLNQRLKDLKAA